MKKKTLEFLENLYDEDHTFRRTADNLTAEYEAYAASHDDDPDMPDTSSGPSHVACTTHG